MHPGITEELLDSYIEILHGDNIVPIFRGIPEKEYSDTKQQAAYLCIRKRKSVRYTKLSTGSVYVGIYPCLKLYLKDTVLYKGNAPGVSKTNKDVLIYQNNYRLSNIDKTFLEELDNVRKSIIV